MVFSWQAFGKAYRFSFAIGMDVIFCIYDNAGNLGSMKTQSYVIFTKHSAASPAMPPKLSLDK